MQSKFSDLIHKVIDSIERNEGLRIKYADDPYQFLNSEMELHDAARQLMDIAVDPQEIVLLLGTTTAFKKIINLVTHPNIDIQALIVQFVSDMICEEDMEEDSLTVKVIDGLKMGVLLQDPITPFDFIDNKIYCSQLVIEALYKYDLIPLLIHALNISDNDVMKQDQLRFNILKITESLLEYNIEVIGNELLEKTNILSLLTGLLLPKYVSDLKLYASELLSIILQNSPNKACTLFANTANKGLERVLVELSHFNTKDPINPEQHEYVCNIVNIICAVITQPALKIVFNECEGLDLMLILIKTGHLIMFGAFKILSFYFETNKDDNGAHMAREFVEKGGLRLIFPKFMKLPNTIKGASEMGTMEHVISIISSLMTSLYKSDDQSSKLRLLNKFVESDFEKTNRLIHLREKYANSLYSQREKVLAARLYLLDNKVPISHAQEATWEIELVNAGLYTIQKLDELFAIIIASVPKKITKLILSMIPKDAFLNTTTLLESLKEMEDNASANGNSIEAGYLANLSDIVNAQLDSSND